MYVILGGIVLGVIVYVIWEHINKNKVEEIKENENNSEGEV